MNITIHPIQALLGLVTVVAIAVVCYRLGFDGNQITWWVGGVLFASIIVAAVLFAFAYQLCDNGQIGAGLGLVAVTASGYTLLYFGYVKDEIPSGGGWAILVSVLVAANLAAAAVTID